MEEDRTDGSLCAKRPQARQLYVSFRVSGNDLAQKNEESSAQTVDVRNSRSNNCFEARNHGKVPLKTAGRVHRQRELSGIAGKAEDLVALRDQASEKHGL